MSDGEPAPRGAEAAMLLEPIIRREWVPGCSISAWLDKTRLTCGHASRSSGRVSSETSMEISNGNLRSTHASIISWISSKLSPSILSWTRFGSEFACVDSALIPSFFYYYTGMGELTRFRQGDANSARHPLETFVCLGHRNAICGLACGDFSIPMIRWQDAFRFLSLRLVENLRALQQR